MTTGFLQLAIEQTSAAGHKRAAELLTEVLDRLGGEQDLMEGKSATYRMHMAERQCAHVAEYLHAACPIAHGEQAVKLADDISTLYAAASALLDLRFAAQTDQSVYEDLFLDALKEAAAKRQ